MTFSQEVSVRLPDFKKLVRSLEDVAKRRLSMMDELKALETRLDEEHVVLTSTLAEISAFIKQNPTGSQPGQCKTIVD